MPALPGTGGRSGDNQDYGGMLTDLIFLQAVILPQAPSPTPTPM